VDIPDGGGLGVGAAVTLMASVVAYGLRGLISIGLRVLERRLGLKPDKPSKATKRRRDSDDD
jgi:hypothetical protein